MTLYEMLDRCMANQTVWIFEHNTYDQNMPLFKGTASDARVDPEQVVWDFLMCEVEYFDCSEDVLDIRVRSEHYNDRIEKHYLFGDKWGMRKSERPWLYSIEISEEKSETNENRN